MPFSFFKEYPPARWPHLTHRLTHRLTQSLTHRLTNGLNHDLTHHLTHLLNLSLVLLSQWSQTVHKSFSCLLNLLKLQLQKDSREYYRYLQELPSTKGGGVDDG